MQFLLTQFVITFLLGSVLGQWTKASEVRFDNLPQIEYELCASIFSYKNKTYFGCIEVDSPGKPWCQLANPQGKAKQVRGFCKVGSIPTATGVDKKGNPVKCNPWSNTSLGKVHGCYAESNKDIKYLCDVGRQIVQCNVFRNNDSIEHSLVYGIAGKKAVKKLEQVRGNETAVTADAVHIVQTESNNDSVPKGLIAGLASVGCVGLLAAGLLMVRKRSISRHHKARSNEAVTLEINKTGVSYSGYVSADKKIIKNGPFLVVSTYTPTLGDEIEVLPGDMITILSEYDDGWAQGVNETRGKVKGVFPKHCLQPWA